MKIGVLGIQGDIQEHLRMIEKTGNEPLWVKSTSELAEVSGLIMPGGESTTMIRLMKKYELWDALREAIASGLPVYATCAGMILLAREIINYPEQETLGVLDIAVERNGYGRQVASFETDLEIPAIGDTPFRAIFIRAPIIEKCGDSVEVLSTYKEKPVLVKQGKILASSFHPELTDDLRIHEYFVKEIIGKE
ncbi:pyridoxal 5'-phosphate synthase glutaminase subunit PdxT [Kosmotoga olearia]|uniref:Pyridoxal 5'-phosphate synthase subunit PdxT n=1 Tax=Kosmotoga olearia (strain ATCC BAA-1733 / DSM 21960 / TBF 19.5.1) TaxID=521045 RepID=PDXT_KOSOT|nr:pyridoxal 5'-phosphate synthase glutaminase subunit PdxT [Kosmotoga olearia]C5CG73.1 RecName: Full=Pyridoxal 5'-phosphate synthase subunit PdxT; AltName: Full=Pdx2; AltName: Full=Pyridoxal 5'-phosphate synthase glutaminase subunit [Kosmotoga olearia TBF 19.5.1]ACR79514.1 SNO glutamine amidotransferase [Kosmotoga olearia TBF 19.5.1]